MMNSNPFENAEEAAEEKQYSPFARAKKHFEKLEIESKSSSQSSLMLSGAEIKRGTSLTSLHSTEEKSTKISSSFIKRNRYFSSGNEMPKDFIEVNPFEEVFAVKSEKVETMSMSEHLPKIIMQQSSSIEIETRKPELPPRPPGGSTSPVHSSPDKPPLPERPFSRLSSPSHASFKPASLPKPYVASLRTPSHRSLMSEKYNVTYLDSSAANRSVPCPYPIQFSANQFPRPPFNTELTQQIKSGVTCVAVSRHVCLIGTMNSVKSFNLTTGEQISSLAKQQESSVQVKVTSTCFLPSSYRANDGVYAWIGFSDGELWFVHGESMEVLHRRISVHSYPVIAIIRAKRQIWTLDDNGCLQIWSKTFSENGTRKENLIGIISLNERPKTLRVAAKQTCYCCLDGCLWTGKERAIEIVDPNDDQNSHKKRLDISMTFGVITCMTAVSSYHCTPSITPFIPNEVRSNVYTGHNDGKLLEWDGTQYCLLRVFDTGSYRISCLLSISDRWIWIAGSTGKIMVVELPLINIGSQSNPPVVIKSWQAASKDSIEMLELDPESVLHSSQLVVVTVLKEGKILVYDALFPMDFRDMEYKRRESTFSTQRNVILQICSWNVDSTKPDQFSAGEDKTSRPGDQYFLDKWVTFGQKKGSMNLIDLEQETAEVPDILVFGLQEIINLESKKNAAKGFLKAVSVQQQQQQIEDDNQTRTKAWKDRLLKAMRDNYKQSFVLIEARNLVGMLIAVIVKEEFLKENRISHIESVTVSTGMGGVYGNKGAIVTRFLLDDSSFCFITSHLPAHQEHVGKRNLDALTILRTPDLKSLTDDNKARLAFALGGDGKQILDHENIFFFGDLNYRIDMERDKCIKVIKDQDWPTLWACDQLLKQRLQQGSTCLLKMFEEAPLKFAPTYKYDPRSDVYDTSEKKRVPAYCDRILFRDSYLHCQSSYLDTVHRVPYQFLFPINSPMFKTSQEDPFADVIEDEPKSPASCRSLSSLKPKIQLLHYKRFECMLSDHRPIGALFKVQVKKINNEAYDKITTQIETAWEKRKREISWDALVKWVIERMNAPLILNNDKGVGFTRSQVEETLKTYDHDPSATLQALNQVFSNIKHPS